MSDAATVLLTIWGFLMYIALAFCLAGAKGDGKIHIRPMFATFDCWIGVYWNSEKGSLLLVPCSHARSTHLG